MAKETLRPIVCRLLIAGMLLLSACGGGGGGGSDTDGGMRPAVIDKAGAERVVAILAASSELVELQEVVAAAPDMASRRISPGLVSHIMATLKTRALDRGPAQQRDGALEGKYTCGSGFMTVDSQWDGPQTVSSCDQVSNLRSTLVFDGCIEGEWYANGSVTLREEGLLCTPSAIYLQFEQVDLENSAQATTLGMADLRMHYADLIWSGTDLTGMTVTVNGDISLTHTDMDAQSNSYSLQLRNYRQALQQLDADTLSLNVSGAVSGYCLDGWITLQTIEPLVYHHDAECPTAGIIRISGEGEATITFTEAGIAIKVNTAAPATISCEEVMRAGC
jgi:hypothetical protein